MSRLLARISTSMSYHTAAREQPMLVQWFIGGLQDSSGIKSLDISHCEFLGIERPPGRNESFCPKAKTSLADPCLGSVDHREVRNEG